MKSNKKGQLDSLYTGVLTIATVGILIALVMYIFSSFGNAVDVPLTAGTPVVLESGYINTTGYTLAQYGQEDFSPSISMTNVTSGQVITSGNWTYSSGVLRNATTTTWSTVNINYTYTYTSDSAASNATTTITTQFVDFLPWLGIILLVLAAGIVLFFVVRSFAGGTRDAT